MGRTEGAPLFIYAESLVDLAIRIGIADLAAAPQEEISRLLGIDPLKNYGTNLTPPGSPQEIYERTLLDEFQAKIDGLQKLKGEELRPIFHNSAPTIPDIAEYLKTTNVKIVHGFPREQKDLPCIAIVPGDEGEQQQYLGQLKYEVVAQPKPGVLRWRLGSDLDADLHIHIVTTNYDETIALFHILKYGLLKYRPALEGYGLREQQMQWTPAQDAPQFLQGGAFVYQRTCIWRCVKDESFEFDMAGFTGLSYSVGAVPEIGREIIPGEDEA